MIIPISTTIAPAIASNKYARNGRPVSAQAQNALVTGYNQVARWRTREFSIGGQLVGIASSVGSPTVVARAYGWSGTTAVRMRYSITLAKPDSSAGTGDPYVQIDMADSSGFVWGSAQAHYGSYADSPNDTLDELRDFTGTIEGVLAAQDVQITITAVNNARFVCATICEETADPDTANGYLQGVVNAQPIYADQRQALAQRLADLVENNGGTQICLTDVATSMSSLTPLNILDGTSTTVTTHTPGLTLDMRYKGRASQTTVPLVLAAYGSATTTTGALRLVDSTGTVVGSAGPFTTAPGWHLAVIDVPMAVAKYDLQLVRTVSGTVSLQYASLFELGT